MLRSEEEEEIAVTSLRVKELNTEVMARRAGLEKMMSEIDSLDADARRLDAASDDLARKAVDLVGIETADTEAYSDEAEAAAAHLQAVEADIRAREEAVAELHATDDFAEQVKGRAMVGQACRCSSVK